jgi:DNA invertase Pin-like site-specific DNA recombinase
MKIYIIYTRKSTDTEDKQVYSLDGQKRELIDLAKKQDLEIVNFYTESKSAKDSGRKEFNKMIQDIQNGKADGILC